jgi:hypothetical protein
MILSFIGGHDALVIVLPVADGCGVLDAAEPDHEYLPAVRAARPQVLHVVAGHRLVVHVLMAVLFGVIIATAASRLPGSRSLVIAGGALFGAVPGVAVEMTWSDGPPEPLARQVPQARRWLAGQPQSPSGYLPR